MSTGLPTEEELKHLYDKKGKEALVWYAWRNALRVLPFLGYFPLRKIWKEDTVKHVFSISRVSLLLANVSKNRVTTYAAAYNARAAANNAAIDAFDARATIDAADYDDHDDYVRAAFYAENAAYAAYAIDAIDAIDAADYNHQAASTRADYNFLINNSQLINQYWFSQPLWAKKGLKGNKPKRFDTDLEQFYQSLKELGLGFLADDLNLIYQAKTNPEQPHWKQYLENPSDSVLISAESLRRFIFEESEEIKAVRVLLLGPGGAGKTTLADRLQGIDTVEQHKATVGINYLSHQALLIDQAKGGFAGLNHPEDLSLFLWDFGGQTLFHGLHQAFLHENCVYVLVVDSRHEQEPDKWLQQIRHMTQSASLPPVLIVVNEYDNCENVQNEHRLQQLYRGGREQGELEFFYLRCNDPTDKRLKVFKQKLLDIAASATKSANRSVLEAGEKLKDQLAKSPVLSGEKLAVLLDEQLPDDYSDKEKAGVVSQLEQLGYLVKAEKNKNAYCLNPTWTIDHAYQFLHLDCVQGNKADITDDIEQRGVVNKGTFKKEAYSLSAKIIKKAEKEGSDKIIPELSDYNLDFLHGFLKDSGVCVALNDDKSLFFPDVAAANEPKSWMRFTGREQAAFEFLLPYFPFGLTARLVSRWMQDKEMRILSTSNVWREGFVLSDKDPTCFLIIRYHYRKAVISIGCFGEQSRIAALISEFWQGLKELIKPINENDITVLPRMDKLILDEDKHLIQATEWLKNVGSIAETVNTMKQQSEEIKQLKREGNQVTSIVNNTVNNSGTMGQTSAGSKNKLEQKEVSFSTLVQEDHKTILLEAIKQVHIDYGSQMELKHREQLLKMEQQVIEGKLEESWYEKISPNINTLTGAVGAIAGLIGLL